MPRTAKPSLAKHLESLAKATDVPGCSMAVVSCNATHVWLLRKLLASERLCFPNRSAEESHKHLLLKNRGQHPRTHQIGAQATPESTGWPRQVSCPGDVPHPKGPHTSALPGKAEQDKRSCSARLPRSRRPREPQLSGFLLPASPHGLNAP